MPRSAAVAAASAAALVAALLPTVMFGDDGELVRAVWGLGLAHPPGFPGYLLLAKPFTLLPLGTVALRVHLASVVAAAAAAALAGGLARRWGAGAHGAWFAAVAFCSAPIVWQQSRLARTYPFLAAATLAAVLLADRILRGDGNARRGAPILLLVAALSTGLHQLMILPLGAALLILALRRPPGWLAALPFVPLGALPFLLLPIRSAAEHPGAGWGETTSLAGLVSHLLQGEYAGKLGGDAVPFLSLLATSVGSIPGEMTVPVTFAALAGLAVLARRRRSAAVLAFAIAAATLLLRARYAGTGEAGADAYRVIVRYLLGVLALAAALAGVGWALLLDLAVGRAGPGARTVATVLTAIAAIALGLRPAVASRSETPWLWHDMARGTLLSAPAKGMVLVGGDDVLFPLWYLQGIGGYAPDRVVVSDQGFGRAWARAAAAGDASRALGLPADPILRAGDAPALVGAVASHGGALSAAMIPPGADPRQAPVLVSPAGAWTASGLAYRLAAPGIRPEGPAAGSEWRTLVVRGPRGAPPAASLVPLSQASWFLTVAARGAMARGRPAEALPLLFRAADLDPSDAVVHNDTGLALMALGLRGPAAEAFRHALALSPGDPDIASNLAVAEALPSGGAPRKEDLR